MFRSLCRICKGYMVGNEDIPGPYVHLDVDGITKECFPSDNLEYLEWCLSKKEKENV